MSFYVGTLDEKGVIKSALAKLLDKELSDLNFKTKNCPTPKGSSVKVNVFEVTLEESVLLSQSIWKRSVYFYKSVGPNSNDIQLFDVYLSKTAQV